MPTLKVQSTKYKVLSTKKKKLVIGVTGGVATGKSTVVKYFRQWGAQVVDLDKIAREVTKKKSTLDKIRRTFGSSVFDGQLLNRRALGRWVFSSASLRKKLEKIIHPMVIRQMKIQINRCKAGPVVVEAPLLFEAGLERRMDYIVVVWAPREKQKQRLLQKRGLSTGELEGRLDSQWLLSRKMGLADAVVRNSGSRQDLKRQARALWKKVIDKKTTF